MAPIIEKPFRMLAVVFAQVGKISASHPIHALVATSLLASFAYLSVIEHFIGEGGLNYDAPSSNVVHYYKAPTASSWSQITDLNELSDEYSHYNVVPLQFKRAGEHTLPDVEDSVVNGEEFVKFIITGNDAFAQDENSLKSLVADDGSVWRYRNYHSKLAKYSDYATKAYNKVTNLIKGAEPFDIALVTLAYIAMNYTFISLFVDMKKIGSRFWLAFATVVSSFFAFLFALYTAINYLNIEISVLSLTEGIPFFVATIGYKNKVLLTEKVLHQYSEKEYLNKGASHVLYQALKEQGSALLRDHLLVIVAFLGCTVYAQHLENLKNFCILAALILIFDLFTTSTFLSGILSLKLEINIINRATVLKQALQEDGLTEETVDEVLKNNSIGGQKALKTSDNSTLVTGAKILAIALFFGFHFFGLGSAWYTDLKDNTEYKDAVTLSESILSQIPTSKAGTLATLYPARFFLPSKVSIQVEDIILTSIGRVSGAIRDKYISKFILFSFFTSVSINVYLLNAARLHTSTVDKDIQFKKPKSQKKAPVEISQSNNLGKDEGDNTKSSEIILSSDSENDQHEPRPLDQLVEIYKDGKVKSLYNDEVVSLVTNGKLPLYALEKQLSDTTRAVLVRRKAIAQLADAPILESNKLPYLHYDYDRVFGACCENVIGFMPLPVGIAGPLIIDGKPYHIPMATTEGCLVASAMRGCKAINLGGGVSTVLTKDGMTRGPCVSFPSLQRAGACKIWLDSEEGQEQVKKAFNSTSRFARLQGLQTALAGDLLFIRFRTFTGDAMGMNMISKGVEFALKQMVEEFGWDDMSVVSVSGNYCTDKKPAAINWIEGRGKSVVAESIVPREAVEKVLKSNVKALVELNINKNLIGSAMAGSVGGFNAHAANLLTAVYLALGQDPAQNVESSNCITLMKETVDGDLQISVSMPSIEVGTIGGGTILDPQGSMLELLGVKGPASVPGENARQLAKIIASIVLAGELSLCSALAAGHLVQSHMTHNRAGAGPTKK